MTTSNQTARTGPYSGNGSTTVFAYDFRILDQTHIVVTLKNAANVETVQTLTTNYTVSGVGTSTGGNITMGVAPASGEQLTFSRAVPQTQEVDLANRGGVQPEILEAAYDKLTQLSQDKVELLNRMPRFPVSSALTDIELPLTLTANTALIVNAAGTGYTTGPTSSQISSAESDAAAAAASAVTAANEASAAMPKYTFSTTTTVADPGVGKLRLNHATPSSASVIIIDLAIRTASACSLLERAIKAIPDQRAARAALAHGLTSRVSGWPSLLLQQTVTKGLEKSGLIMARRLARQLSMSMMLRRAVHLLTVLLIVGTTARILLCAARLRLRRTRPLKISTSSM